MELILKQGRWATAERRPRAAHRPRLLRAVEWLLPWGAWLLRGGYFCDGVERGVCRAIHRAAARGTLYSFAPPPPLKLVAHGRGRWAADEYRFRSPFVSHIAQRNQAYVRHYQCGARHRPLLIVNHGTGSFAALLERYFLGRLLAAGLDVAIPVAPGFYRRRGAGDHRGGWAATVGAALSAMVQLVHDNVAVESWARGRGYRTVAVSGIGLGGTVAAVLAATTARFDAAIPMLAGAHPGRLWLPPRALARAVDRRALARAGVRHARTLVRLFDPVAPVRLPRPRLREHCAVVGLRFDTLVPAADVRDLAAHWRVAPLWLSRCHVELPRCAGELVAIVTRLTLQAAA
jgi:hypothetical protein